MFTYAIIAIGIYGVFTYRKGLSSVVRVSWEMSAYSKMVACIFFLGIIPLIYSDLLPQELIYAAYAYALALFSYQLYRIVKQGRRSGCFLPRPTYWLVPCVVFTMATPVCDLFLQRSYSAETCLWVGASSISYVCLYLIEVYIRYPYLERDQVHHPKAAME